MLLPLFPCPLQSFSLQAVIESEVLKELLKLDPQKTSGSDGLNPFFFKVAAPIINKPITDLFNLSLLSGQDPIDWKAAMVILFCSVYQKIITKIKVYIIHN